MAWNNRNAAFAEREWRRLVPLDAGAYPSLQFRFGILQCDRRCAELARRCASNAWR